MNKLLSLVTAAALLLALASPADADFRIRIEDTVTGQGVVVTDNGAGDSNPLANVITVNTSFGAYSVNVSVGTSTPVLVAHGFGDAIDLTQVTVATTGPSTLRVTLEQTGFNNQPNGDVGLVSQVGGTLSAPAGSSATFNGFANPGNLVPTLGADTFPAGALPAIPDLPPAGSTQAGPLVFGNGAFSGEATAHFVKSGPYSLFLSDTVVFTGAGSVSFDHLVGTTTPAPAGLVLLAAGLPCLALGYFRRKKAAVQA